MDKLPTESVDNFMHNIGTLTASLYCVGGPVNLVKNTALKKIKNSGFFIFWQNLTQVKNE